jgi:hypothetical protein
MSSGTHVSPIMATPADHGGFVAAGDPVTTEPTDFPSISRLSISRSE